MKKRTVWMMGMLLAGTLATYAADVRFFRITGPTSTVISALSADGTVAWTNEVVGVTCTVESAYSTDDNFIWERYTELAVTSSVTRLRIFDPNPPAGMVLIPAGSFMMGNAFPSDFAASGDELPQHTVNVSAFYMDVYEVTKALWDEVKAFNGANGYTYSNTGLGKATNHPVHTVNWYDAVKWCNARSQRDGLTPVYYTDAGFTTVYKTNEIAPFANWAANGYRLPTEAEWEKAARGGAANTRFPWTDNANYISWTKANYYGQSDLYSYDQDGESGAYHPTFATGETPYTSPVGYFAPNGYGLYDMAGNAWEWCWDWYDGSYYASSPASDPSGPADPLSSRVTRSGSWDNRAGAARVADRYGTDPAYETSLVGFRCARGL
ncbi:MAG: Serine/threonine-protein kinase pkn1 [Verrucomicrobia bacterium ADurb.Bin345]|nr:MAG: Serine/threonine-protein kinase pkn1 [Verrucomicrobia bacterium ADurb.Bin345]